MLKVDITSMFSVEEVGNDAGASCLLLLFKQASALTRAKDWHSNELPNALHIRNLRPWRRVDVEQYEYAP